MIVCLGLHPGSFYPSCDVCGSGAKRMKQVGRWWCCDSAECAGDQTLVTLQLPALDYRDLPGSPWQRTIKMRAQLSMAHIKTLDSLVQTAKDTLPWYG